MPGLYHALLGPYGSPAVIDYDKQLYYGKDAKEKQLSDDENSWFTDEKNDTKGLEDSKANNEKEDVEVDKQGVISESNFYTIPFFSGKVPLFMLNVVPPSIITRKGTIKWATLQEQLDDIRVLVDSWMIENNYYNKYWTRFLQKAHIESLFGSKGFEDFIKKQINYATEKRWKSWYVSLPNHNIKDSAIIDKIHKKTSILISENIESVLEGPFTQISDILGGYFRGQELHEELTDAHIRYSDDNKLQQKLKNYSGEIAAWALKRLEEIEKYYKNNYDEASVNWEDLKAVFCRSGGNSGYSRFSAHKLSCCLTGIKTDVLDKIKHNREEYEYDITINQFTKFGSYLVTADKSNISDRLILWIYELRNKNIKYNLLYKIEFNEKPLSNYSTIENHKIQIELENELEFDWTRGDDNRSIELKYKELIKALNAVGVDIGSGGKGLKSLTINIKLTRQAMGKHASMELEVDVL